jgi:hypothetical protein
MEENEHEVEEKYYMKYKEKHECSNREGEWKLERQVDDVQWIGSSVGTGWMVELTEREEAWKNWGTDVKEGRNHKWKI